MTDDFHSRHVAHGGTDRLTEISEPQDGSGGHLAIERENYVDVGARKVTCAPGA